MEITLEEQKVSDEQFAEFVNEFNLWQIRLGLVNFAVTIECGDAQGCYALCTACAESCTAVVTMSQTYSDSWEEDWIKQTAKHEALHLLLSRFADMARDRFACEKQLEIEEECVVRVLERVLG